MNRKDTILVAVVVNAVLLVVLFVTAIKSDDAESVPIAKAKEVIELPAQKKNELKVARGDEIDQVLREFSKKQEERQKQQIAEKPKETVKNDFVNDLKALTVNATEEKTPKVKKLESGVIEVTVKKGDALAKIARRYQTTVTDIMQLNNLTNTNLRIGQILRVKSSGSNVASASDTASAKFYIVKNGDNPWTIAVKNQIKVDELLRLNNLNEEKARHLKPGDRLRIN